MRKRASLLFPILFAALAGAANADVTIVSKMDGEMHTIRATGQKISMSGLRNGMIFRGDQKLMWILNPEKKTYSEMTEADLQAMEEKMNAPMAELEKMKAQLPPAMLEQMKRSMPGAAAPKRTVVPMNEARTINGFPCRGYAVSSESGSASEVWSTDPASVELEPEDLSAFKEFAAFMKTMMPGMESWADWAKDFDHPKEGQVPGVPILTIVKDESGKELHRTELVRVEHGAVATSEFEVPAGYTEKAITGMAE